MRLFFLFACASICASAAANTAVFQQFDTTTRGSWKGVYGQGGYIIPNDSNSPPAYGVVTSSGANPYTWVASSTDPRSVIKGSSTTDRIASAFYTSSSFTFDLNLTDGQTHQIAIYCLDLDYGNRSQKISFTDSSTGATLNSQNLTNFAGGVYEVWNVSGHVSLQVTYTSGLNAVASGIFFGGGGSGAAPPTVSITSPAASVVSGSLSVSASASSTVGINNVQFKLDGVSLGAAVSSAPYTTQWSTASASNGSHALTAVATDTLGQSAVSSPVTVTVSNAVQTNPPPFVKFDSSTQGSWRGTYGGDGYVIANDSLNLPSYATLTPSGASLYSWYPSTTDPRALLKGASATDRIASTYYSGSSFSFDLNLTDGQSHQVALYALDLDTTSRTQTVSIQNVDTGAVLDTETFANFHYGVYAVWNLQGHIKLLVTSTGGLNAVVSGLFFGGAGTIQTPAPPAVSVTGPAAGSTVANSIQVTATASSTAAIASLQFLLDGSNLGSLQSGSGPSFSTQWATTSAANGSHTLSAIATDTLGQKTTSTGIPVTVANSVVSSGAAATFAKFDSATLGTWKGMYGQDGYVIANDSNAPPSYATFAVSGANAYTWVASSSDQRALLKGASTTDRIASTYYTSSSFTFDLNLTGGTHQIALYCLDLDSTSRSQTISILDATSNAVLDTESMSNFHNGVYAIWNIQGHVLIRVANTGSSNAVVSGIFFGAGGSSIAPAGPTVSISSPAANATVSGSVVITATASAPAGLSSVQFQLDGANLGSAVLGAGPTFSTTWTATSGSHTLSAIATDTLGQHASSAAVPVTVASQGTARSSFLGFDTTTQGNWKGAYGQNGYYIPNDSASPPSYGTVTPVGASLYTWFASTTDPRALLKGNSTTDRIASTYYTGSSSTFSFDVNLSDGQLHEMALYLFDVDNLGRGESISILDAATNAVLDTETVASFKNGVYATWNVQGHILIQIRLLASLNPLVNGLFFGPPILPPALQLSTGALAYSSTAGAANPAAQSLAISNSGGGMLNWTATHNQNWLTLSASAGAAPSSVTIGAVTTGLAPGTYTDTITISAANATGSPQTIAVTLNLATPPAVLNLSTSTLVFSGTTGDPSESPESVTITNTGGGALNWSATHTQPWLTLPTTTGAAPGMISVNVNLTGLAAGTYSDTIIVSGGSGVLTSPQTITVSLRVTPPASLVANWTFEPATISGSTVSDISGDNLYATIYGNVTPVPGKIGQALSFDGVSGYLRTQPDLRPAMVGDLTLAMWIRTTNASRTESLISKYDLSGAEDGYIIETNAAGYLAVQLGGANLQANGLIVDGVHKINDGQWHHAAVIIRAGQDVSFYVDGGLSSVYYLTSSQGGFTPPVTIGGGVATHSNPFTGSLDETRIYSRALSTPEIAALYGGTVTTTAGGQTLYNGIALPNNFPPPTTPTQIQRTPYYINNPPRVIPIDVGRQLFVDDFLIDQTTLLRAQHQPSIYPNPVLTPGTPISSGTFYDPATQQYKMWYYNTDYPNNTQYAYSIDGVHWTKPSITDALVPNTDVVINGGADTVWLDLQESDPTRRYKTFQVDAGALKVYVYFSADGIHWSARQAFDINTLSDRTTFFWNPFRSVWVNSDRATTGFAATPFEAAYPKRARFYSESKDLATWTPSDPKNTYWTGADDHDPPYYLNNPGGQPPELYTLDCAAYESVLLGMFSWFYPGVGYSTYTLPGPVLTELGVGFSRDGFSWVRPTRSSGPTGAFIPASNTAGTWNAYNTQSVGGSFLVVGNEIWFYFSGRTLQKPLDGTFSTGLATLRRDGFYSMDAGSTQGTLTTRTIKFSGSHLFVNVNDPAGQLLVDVLDSSGNVIPGFAAANSTPVAANTTLQEITWNGANLAALAGQTVKFRFYLTNGSLYSFWVTPSAQGASYGYVGAGGPGFTGVTDTIGSGAYLAGQH